MAEFYFDESYLLRRPSPFAFILWTLFIFAMMLSAMHSIGLVPYYIDGTEPNSTTPVPPVEETTTVTGYAPIDTGSNTTLTGAVPETQPPQNTLAFPERVKIPSIKMDLPVQNVASRDLVVLDEALKDGPIRYTDSALLGEEGNMLIFAHSSNLPVVVNQMYKAFNRLKELKEGAEITIEGGNKTYVYVVQTVRETNAEDEIIDLSKMEGTRLTLSTCDTLTSKSARYVVEANLVSIIESE